MQIQTLDLNEADWVIIWKVAKYGKFLVKSLQLPQGVYNCAFKHTIQMEYCLWQSFVPFGAQIMGWLAWLGVKKFGELLLRRGIIEAPNAMRKICGDFHESAHCVTALPECSDDVVFFDLLVGIGVGGSRVN